MGGRQQPALLLPLEGVRGDLRAEADIILAPLPLLAFKASGMLLLLSPGGRVVNLRPGKGLPTHFGIVPSKEGMPNPKGC